MKTMVVFTDEHVTRIALVWYPGGRAFHVHLASEAGEVIDQELEVIEYWIDGPPTFEEASAFAAGYFARWEH